MSTGLMPHGYCLLWSPGLLRLHVISDALIGLSYTTIPFTLAYFVRNRKDLPFSWMFLCFGLFIIACGATHYMEIWTLWVPSYWLSGFVKAVTAAASIPTAYLLVRLMPRALALPSPEQLLAANRKLGAEFAQRAKAEAKFQALLEAAPVAMVIVDPKGRIVIVNIQTEKLFGYRREELLGQTVEILIPGRYRSGHVGHRSHYFSSPRPRPMGAGLDLFGRRKDGSEFAVEISLSPLETEEETLVMSAIRDTTERKRGEDTLRDSKTRAEAAFEELEAFSYSVAHDLRAPLRKMDGFSQAVLDDYGDKLGPEGKDCLQRVRSASQNMAQLIDDLLSLSRVTRSEIHPEPVDLSAMAESIAADLRQSGPGREVQFVISPGLTASADAQLLADVLENLLSNAWKFTAGHSRARIEFGAVELQGLTSYFVRDDGAGFDPAFADKLFSPFQRLHKASEFPGSGIGLATVKRIIHRHGGRVWAESAVEKGAAFYFTLQAGRGDGGK